MRNLFQIGGKSVEIRRALIDASKRRRQRIGPGEQSSANQYCRQRTNGGKPPHSVTPFIEYVKH
jgi:hypothetical protein